MNKSEMSDGGKLVLIHDRPDVYILNYVADTQLFSRQLSDRLRRIALDLDRQPPSDEEIKKEAFRYANYLDSLPLQGTVHINCFETGAKWLRDKMTRQTENAKPV